MSKEVINMSKKVLSLNFTASQTARDLVDASTEILRLKGKLDVRGMIEEIEVSLPPGKYRDPDIARLSLIPEVLATAGFNSFPFVNEQKHQTLPRMVLERRQRVTFEGEIVESEDAQLQETRPQQFTFVSGPSSAVEKLCSLCPVHCLNDDSLLAPASFKVLAVEIKASVETLLKDIKEAKKEGGGISWIFQPPMAAFHKVVFLNGGGDSKNFIQCGASSTLPEEREVWQELRHAGVSLFYKQSFALEWMTDLSKAVDKQADELAALKQQLEKLLAK